MIDARRLIPALLLGALLACGDGTGQISVISPTVSVSGFARDYFTMTPAPTAALTADDHPALTATSGTDGSYTFPAVSTSSTLRVIAARTSYRATRNETLTIGSSALVADVFAVSTADAQRQYTGLGLTQTINTGVVIVNLRDGAGQPRVGIPVADIVLLDAAQAPVGLGPYVFGAGGDVVSQAMQSVSAVFSNRSRVAFLDVPPGTLTLRVTVPGPQTLTASVMVTANGVTLVQR